MKPAVILFKKSTVENDIQGGPKVAHFSTHHILGNVQKMNGFHQNVPCKLDLLYRTRKCCFQKFSRWYFGYKYVKYRAILVIFTARCYASAVLAMALCPSVRPSQAGVLLKRLNVGSRRQHFCHTIAQDSSFRTSKISAKFRRDHPLRGRQMQVGWVKIGDFRQIAGYISKTVQDRRMVSIKVE